MKGYSRRIAELGEALKILRNRKGLTQKELGKLAGLSARQVRQLERGRHSGGVETILLICDGLETNPFALLVLAWERDFVEFIKNADKLLTKEVVQPDNEVKVNRERGKVPSAVTKIRAKNFAKGLLGGGTTVL